MCLGTGDVLTGTWSDGVRYPGVMEEWFGQQWWSKRSFLLLLTTLLVFAPLISFKRVGEPLNHSFCFVLFMFLTIKNTCYWVVVKTYMEPKKVRTPMHISHVNILPQISIIPSIECLCMLVCWVEFQS